MVVAGNRRVDNWHFSLVACSLEQRRMDRVSPSPSSKLQVASRKL